MVTNVARPAEPIPALYNQRGAAEQWIKEVYAYLPDWDKVRTYCSMMRELWPDVQILIWLPTTVAAC
jgi:hypothetical protein